MAVVIVLIAFGEEAIFFRNFTVISNKEAICGEVRRLSSSAGVLVSGLGWVAEYLAWGVLRGAGSGGKDSAVMSGRGFGSCRLLRVSMNFCFFGHEFELEW